ncbi:uncharacterized protein LOC112632473 [Theropithecus gelada]|uniref:uncharacterized protein LOC112632473 n=1 Tax=Theropithecus gelada TaxID=9565 RepID=UPI000DC19DB2|nr:uncharacterized protein LOC112632473 [Theropithecus gelada]
MHSAAQTGQFRTAVKARMSCLKARVDLRDSTVCKSVSGQPAAGPERGWQGQLLWPTGLDQCSYDRTEAQRLRQEFSLFLLILPQGEKFRYETINGQLENACSSGLCSSETLTPVSAKAPSLSFPHSSTGPTVLLFRSPQPCLLFLDIWYSALHSGTIGVGQLWIKAFSQSKATFFTKDSGRRGCWGIIPASYSSLGKSLPSSCEHQAGQQRLGEDCQANTHLPRLSLGLSLREVWREAVAAAGRGAGQAGATLSQPAGVGVCRVLRCQGTSKGDVLAVMSGFRGYSPGSR